MFDLPGYISSYPGTRVTDSARGEYRIRECPKCKSYSYTGKDRHWYCFCINVRTEKYHCQHCGFSGSSEESDQAIPYLVYIMGGDVITKSVPPIEEIIPQVLDKMNRKSRPPKIPKTFDAVPGCIPLSPTSLSHCNAMNYLVKRGLDIGDILLYNIHVGKEKFKGNPVFPIYNGANKLVAFQVRFINAEFNKRYHNEGNMGEILYPQHLGRSDEIIIVEGIFDALAINKALAPEMAGRCLFTKSATVEQLDVLQSINPQIVTVGLDPTAHHEYYDLSRKLNSRFSKVYFLDGLTHDPGWYMEHRQLSELKNIINNAKEVKDIFTWTVKQIMNGQDK